MSNIPPGWELVQFGDVVKKVERKIPDREQWNFNRYIAGEHIPSGEIRIKDYGDLEGTENVLGSAFHMKFEPGDILYVTRRAYLRKGGIVNFTGVCSNVTFIFNAKKDRLLNELLPFIIQTESFVKHCTDNSHGSTNPFLNWKDIAQYKLLLPPIKEQKKIANILWSIEEAQEKLENLIQITNKSKEQFLEKLLTKGIGHKKFKETELGEIPEDWKINKFSDVMKINPETLSGETDSEYEFEYIDISSIEKPNVISKTESYKFLNAPSRARRIVKNRDVIISTVRPYLKGFALIKENKDNLVCSTGFAVLRETNYIIAEFILQYCLSQLFQEQSNIAMVGSNYPALNTKMVEKMLIPLPPIVEQKQIISILESIDKQLENANMNLNNLKNLKMKILNSYLSGNLLISKEVKT